MTDLKVVPLSGDVPLSKSKIYREAEKIMDSKIANAIFKYDNDTGKLFWKIKPSRKVAVGTEIKGEDGDGYLRVGYKGTLYRVHRIIWLMIYGGWPNRQIDHADHDRTNNKLANLRDVSHRSNHKNKSIPVNNTAGFLGIHFDKKYKKWRARGTRSDGVRKHIGYFDKKEDAIEARKKFNRNNGYHRNHGS